LGVVGCGGGEGDLMGVEGSFDDFISQLFRS
jgi:hypothetical protein